MLSAAGFATIAAVLKARSGLTIGPDKTYLLETRLADILKRHALADLAALAARLAVQPSGPLAAEVVEAMTTNESFFFRDDKPFAHVRRHALPALHAARGPGVPIRIWSAAAATGQEAWSLAMLVAELRPMLGERIVQILGTDIAREPLSRARAGLYSQFEVQRGLPVQMLIRHFEKRDARWHIRDTLRGNVTFHEWNLLDDPRPLGTFDIVFCRNVLIYFDTPVKSRVLAAIARQIAPDGFLYLGGAETVMGITDRWLPADGGHGVYVPAVQDHAHRSARGGAPAHERQKSGSAEYRRAEGERALVPASVEQEPAD